MADLLRKLSDANASGSLSNRLRARRFAAFALAVERLPKPVRILDIGGTITFWEQRGWAGREDVRITLVNRDVQTSPHSNIEATIGDATDLSRFRGAGYDIAFSNSVIEHLFEMRHQREMAQEVMRVAPAYWVQTPNFWFPVEPHFLCFGWQWLPEWVRVFLIQRRRWGWRGPCRDPELARRIVREVRLLSRRELRGLFPDGRIHAERFLGLAKSWIVERGLGPTDHSVARDGAAQPGGAAGAAEQRSAGIRLDDRDARRHEFEREMPRSGQGG